MNITLLVAVAICTAAPESAHVRTTPAHFDCGEVRSGTPLSRTFRLTNDAKGPIDIVGVEPGCGCLRTALTERVLPSGASVDLIVDINTLSQPVGANTWRVRVAVSEVLDGKPSISYRELLVKARVVREIDVDPVSVGLSTTGEIDQIVTVRDARPKPLKLVSVSTGSKHFRSEIVVPDAVEPERMRVRLIVPADCPIGTHADVLTIRTSDPDYPEIRVPIRVTKRPRGGIEAFPEVATLRFGSGQPRAAVLIRLRDLDEKPVKVASVTCDTAGIVCSSVPGPGSMATLKIVGEAARLPADGRGSVTVAFDDASKTVRKIPIEWLLP